MRPGKSSNSRLRASEPRVLPPLPLAASPVCPVSPIEVNMATDGRAVREVEYLCTRRVAKEGGPEGFESPPKFLARVKRDSQIRNINFARFRRRH